MFAAIAKSFNRKASFSLFLITWKSRQRETWSFVAELYGKFSSRIHESYRSSAFRFHWFSRLTRNFTSNAMHTARMQERDFTVKKVVSRNRITKFISYALDQVTNELSSNNQLLLLTLKIHHILLRWRDH